jgi:deazaflavin-dependent oxidoreductase (nitroreductase family)
MPIPKAVARLNRIGLNRVTERFAPWVPGFGVVVHRGRRSGRTFRTPVNVFLKADGYVFALTYGMDTDWVKNVRAAGACELETRGRRLRLITPEIYHDESRRDVPNAVRQILRLIHVADFLAMQTDPPIPPEG